MTIIRRFINWLKSLFRKFFRKKKKNRIINKEETNLISNKQKSFKAAYNGSLPSYMFISSKEKEKLLYTLSLMINLLEENNSKLLEKENSELIKYIQSVSKINNDLISRIIEENKLLNNKDIEVLSKDLTNEEKNTVINKYQMIINSNNEYKIHLNEINKVIKLINKTDISIIKEDEINREITNITCDKNIVNNSNKIKDFSKKIFSIIENLDEDFTSEVLKDYKEVNYITISTTIIDKNYERLMKLEEDFKNHRFNRYYYEREINKIKKELSRLKEIKNNKEVSDHINYLKKELYTKSKDKYDLLYNNEIFMNIESECDELLSKINAKVIDIKKEKEVEKEKDSKEDDYLKKILLRFQDMELARKLILLSNEEEKKITNKNDIIKEVNEIYNKFNNGIEENFNFEKNKKRTELVVLFNDINKIISTVKKEDYIPVEHINFRLNDLIEASIYKKDELDMILHNNKVTCCDSSVIDEKLDILGENINNKNAKILKKNNN